MVAETDSAILRECTVGYAWLTEARECMVDAAVSQHLLPLLHRGQNRDCPVSFGLIASDQFPHLGVIPVGLGFEVAVVQGVVQAENLEGRGASGPIPVQAPCRLEHVQILAIAPGHELPEENLAPQVLVPFERHDQGVDEGLILAPGELGCEDVHSLRVKARDELLDEEFIMLKSMLFSQQHDIVILDDLVARWPAVFGEPSIQSCLQISGYRRGIHQVAAATA